MNTTPEQTDGRKGIASATTVRGPESWRSSLPTLAIGLTLAMLMLPLDPIVANLALKFQPGGGLTLGGDMKRELEFVQQFGAFTSVILIWIAILRLDPRGITKLPSFLVATALNSLICNALKMSLGRPRPKFLSAFELTLPWEKFNLPTDEGTRLIHAWESSQLWSFPSSHTAAAAVLSVYLARMYPRLRELSVALVVIVATARVVLFAHYPSDVIAGATIGLVIGRVGFSRILPNGISKLRERES